MRYFLKIYHHHEFTKSIHSKHSSFKRFNPTVSVCQLYYYMFVHVYCETKSHVLMFGLSFCLIKISNRFLDSGLSICNIPFLPAHIFSPP